MTRENKGIKLAARHSSRLGIIFVLGMLLIISSCGKEDGGNETKISSYSSHESHNTGQNCMNCHKSGGEGSGWFNVGGSIFKVDLVTPNAGSTVYLYTGINGTGTLKATLQVDAKGNFYTTENVDFGTGLYPQVKNPDDSIQYMTASITTGACNSCHGVSQIKMWNY